MFVRLALGCGGGGGGGGMECGGVEGGGGRAKGECIGVSYLGLTEVNARVGRGDFRGKKLHSLSASHAQIERCAYLHRGQLGRLSLKSGHQVQLV